MESCPDNIPPHEITSYRPISLLPVVSKVFEKLLLNRMHPLVASHSLIPAHQFGFRKRQSTIEQTHHVHRIQEALQTKQYCSAVFLDISEAFDKMWHTGLLYKLRRALPLIYFLLLKSYLLSRHFLVKIGTDQSALTSINAGVPQGSVLVPLLYLLYTEDLPTSPGTLTATFADDTSMDIIAIQHWFKTWRMKANETKSAHVTFITRCATCPPVHINDVQLPQSDDVNISIPPRQTNFLA
jgi:hypothetical protein